LITLRPCFCISASLSRNMVKRTLNPRLIKARRSYTLAEVARLYGLHLGTVQRWRKEGLQLVDEDSRPFLVLGLAVRHFLEERRRKRRHRLEDGEFFCPRCRLPRRSAPGALCTEMTEKRLGRVWHLVVLRGRCEVCSAPLWRYSSDRQLRVFQAAGLALATVGALPRGNAGSAVSAYMEGGGDGPGEPKERAA